jgi:parallel beta-helix repeat protein
MQIAAFCILVLGIIFLIILFYRPSDTYRQIEAGENVEYAMIKNESVAFIKLNCSEQDLSNLSKIRFNFYDSLGTNYSYETSESPGNFTLNLKNGVKNFDYNVTFWQANLSGFNDIIGVGASFEHENVTFTNTTTVFPNQTNATGSKANTTKPNKKPSTGGGGGPSEPVITCTPKNCSQLGYECGTQTNNCGNSVSCGGCSSGYECNSTGMCNLISCTNDTGCSAGGIFCSGNMSYNCSLGGSGCLNRTNLSLCAGDFECVIGQGCQEIKNCTLESDCDYLDLPQISSCNDSSDSNPFTLDFAPGNSSTCNQNLWACTVPSYAFTHTCNISCGAECTDSCAPLDCEDMDACVDGDYYDYHDVSRSCNGCLCETKSCNNYTVYPSYPGCNYSEMGCGFVIEPGNYRLGSDLITGNNSACIGILSDDVIFDCEGHVIEGNGTSNSAGFYLRGRNITVKNCKVMNMKDGGEGIYSESSNESKIHDCTFNNTEYGIYLIRSENSTILNNKFYQTEMGIEVRNSSSWAYIEGNSFAGTNSSGNAIWIHSSNNRIIYNTIRSYNKNGIVIYYGAKNISVLYNNISSTRGVGIATYGWDIIVGWNHLESVGGTAISIGRDLGMPTSVKSNITLKSNNISSSNFGIFFEAGRENIIENNIIYNSTGYAIYPSADQGNIFRNNLITSSLRGISLDYANNTQIINNTISDNDLGIYAAGTNLSIKFNRVCGNDVDFSCGGSGVSNFSNNQCGHTGYICGGQCQQCGLPTYGPFTGLWKWIKGFLTGNI